ncbi:MAG: hypothetical protein OXL39_16055 [Caldilineaceae bacterium]|nr:hypothetical protein [Caldilineaceae bacterium]
MDYHVSEERQNRLQRLLTLSGTGLLSSKEQQELDELEEVEHLFVMLKAEISSKRDAGKG